MKRIYIITLLLTIVCGAAMAQTAMSVLDRAAAAVDSKGGAYATFTISGENISPTDGTIEVKGMKFHTTMPNTIVWFDGRTQWTYLVRNNEVNVNTPTEAELQRINPYSFLSLYRNGYKLKLTQTASANVVYLTATDSKKSIKELEITINKSTAIPTQVKMKQNDKWYHIKIREFKKSNLSDNIFCFPQNKYPDAEIIDLR